MSTITGNSYLNNLVDNAKDSINRMNADKMTNTGGKKFTPEEADSAAKKFEAMFMSSMLGLMFEGVKADPMFGGGSAEKTYKSMLIDEYGKVIANRDTLGISDMVKKEMLKLQEAENKQGK